VVNGIEVTDKLFFCTGDKPAAQFERGAQQGGYYKINVVLVDVGQQEQEWIT